jgi:hypothetical protein
MNTAILKNNFPRLVVAVLAAVIVIGFARTFYLRFLFDLPPLARRAHVHGLLWTLWIALHYIQARLIAGRRADLHRRFGIAGVALGVLLIWDSATLSIAGAAAGHAPPLRDPLQFLSVSLGTTGMFAAFFALAIALRHRREWHKRLMLLATMVLLLPAVGRLDGLLFQLFGTPRIVVPFIVSTLFVAWAMAHDWRKRGEIHLAYWLGGTALLAMIPLRAALGYTDTWYAFARWVTGV